MPWLMWNPCGDPLASERSLQIDAIRGLAVLLMVMVHAAADWQPVDVAEAGVLGTLVAGLGGLAAPLFVTLAGWGMARSRWTLRKGLVRCASLCIAQVLVNLAASHRFDPFSPGILTLLGCLAITSPVWLRVSRAVGWRVGLMLLGMIALAPMMLGDLSGPASWDARITTSDAQAFVQHVLLTGTYPLLPWAGFAILGAGIADRVIEGRWWHLLLISGGLAVCTGALVVAMQRGAVFAAPIGPAMLEFFPPNSMFLIAAATGVGILWIAISHLPPTRLLTVTGRYSLTIYLLHFLVLGWFHDVDDGGWTLAQSLPAVLAFTMLWVPVAWLHDRLAPTNSIEAWIQRLGATAEE